MGGGCRGCGSPEEEGKKEEGLDKRKDGPRSPLQLRHCTPSPLQRPVFISQGRDWGGQKGPGDSLKISGKARKEKRESFGEKLGYHSKLLAGHSFPLWDTHPAGPMATKLGLSCFPPPPASLAQDASSRERKRGRVMIGGDLRGGGGRNLRG